MSGLDVAEHGRAHGYSAPIIVYSSTLDPAVRSRYVRAGVSAFVEKPGGVASLLTAIHEVRQSQRQEMAPCSE